MEGLGCWAWGSSLLPCDAPKRAVGCLGGGPSAHALLRPNWEGELYPRFTTYDHKAMGVHVLPTTQFKTNTIVLNIQAPLTEARVTKTALLPHLLVRGTDRSPTQTALMARLEELYGAFLFADTFKLGERHILQLRLEVANGKYLPGQPQLLKEAIAFMWELLSRPAQEAGAFRSRWVALEKEALRRRVEGLLDHKPLYSRVQCFSRMFRNEPFRLLATGRIEDLVGLEPLTLTDYHAELLAEAPMDLYVVGDVEPEVVAEEVRQVFVLPTRPKGPLQVRNPRPESVRSQTVEERLDVGQCQVVLGLRSPVLRADVEHPVMEVFNGLLGGYAHSKFFTQIREREGMAYSVQSNYNPHMGIVICQAGVDPVQVDGVSDLMRDQLTALRAGTISDEEMQQTKAMLALSVREAADSASSLAMSAYGAHLSGQPHDPDGLVARVNLVTKEQVVDLAQRVEEDTCYLLRDLHTPSGTPDAIKITAPFWAEDAASQESAT